MLLSLFPTMQVLQPSHLTNELAMIVVVVVVGFEGRGETSSRRQEKVTEAAFALLVSTNDHLNYDGAA
jgi:hypothetical protein